MGQNYGARAFDRVRRILSECFLVAALYVVAISAVLWLGAPLIVILFDAEGETATLLVFLCHLAGLMWLFLGGIFVATRPTTTSATRSCRRCSTGAGRRSVRCPS